MDSSHCNKVPEERIVAREVVLSVIVGVLLKSSSVNSQKKKVIKYFDCL